MTRLTDALWSIVANGDGLLLIEWKDGSRRERTYVPVGSPARFEKVLNRLIWEKKDPKVGLVPRRDRHLDNLGEGTVLWASVENTVAKANLSEFRPQPTLTLRVGRSVRSIGLWWLEKPLPVVSDPSRDWLTVANKRLAYAVKANSRHADPAWLLPVGNVTIESETGGLFSPRFISKLRDPPVRRVPSVR